MKNALRKMLGSMRGALDIGGVVIDVVLTVALIPVIIVFVNNITRENASNLSASENTLLGLVTLFIILALIFNIAKQAGLMKKK